MKRPHAPVLILILMGDPFFESLNVSMTGRVERRGFL